MDIVSLSATSQIKQRKPRRHTTEVRIEELPKWNKEHNHKDKTSTLPLSTTHLTPEHALHFEDDLSQDDNDQEVPMSGLTKNALTASWHNLEDNNDLEGGRADYYQGSQVDMLQEMRANPYTNHLETPKHGYQLSYELALDNMLSPFASPVSPPLGMTPTSYTGHVIMELVTTERTYVGDLTDIVEGYVVPLESRVGSLQLSKADIESLFGNVKEIKDFNRSVLHSLKACGESSKKVGQCFLEKAEGFKAHYSRYCNNYPNSIQVLSRLTQDSSISRFLKICQQRLNHMLPLGAFLLKPVQRVLKYALLLGQIVKRMSVQEDGFPKASSALDKMTSVSKHINEMKKRYDAVIHIQELQSFIRGSEEIDLTQYGDLVLEENLRYGSRATGPTIRGRTERHMYVFLFRKLMLMTKKEDDGYQYKTHLEVKDIQLTERVEKDANCFQIRQVSTGRFFTLQAPTLKSKEKWVKNVKMLLMESIPGLPDKAKKLIMAGFPTDFGDVARKSPKSPRRPRHPLEETTSSSSSSPAPSKKASRQGRTSSDVRSSGVKKPRNRSNSLAERLVQASLMATLQLEPFPEDSPAEEKVEEAKELNGKRDRARKPSDVGREEVTKEKARDTDLERETDVVPAVTVSPPDDDTNECKETGHVQSINSVAENQPVDSPRLPSQPLESSDASHPQQQSSEPPDDTVSLAHSSVSETPQAREQSGTSVPQNDIHIHEGETRTQDVTEEAVPLTRINSVDSVDEESVKGFVAYATKDKSDASTSDYTKQEADPRSSLIFDPPPMFQGSDSDGDLNRSAPVHPAKSNSLDLNDSNASSVFTDDDESLFNDLMSKGSASSTPMSSHGTSLDQRDAQVLRTLLHSPQDSISESDGAATTGAPRLPPPMQFATFEDENETPKATPNSLRRWTVRRSRKKSDPDKLFSTPTASPLPLSRFPAVADDASSPVLPGNPLTFTTVPPSMDEDEISSKTYDKSHLVVRSHSYTSQHQHRIIHRKEGSRSSGNSPEESPNSGSKEKKSASKMKRHSSFTKGSISVVGLFSTTRNDLSLEESCVPIEHSVEHVPPPQQSYTIGTSNQDSPRIGEDKRLDSPRVLKLSRSRESSPSPRAPRKFEALPSKQPEEEKRLESVTTPLASVGDSLKASPDRLNIPFGGNLNEELSFDEALQSYDDYASATGKTAKTKAKEQKKRSRSPNVSKKGKKKDRKRSMTVTGIDAATILAAKEAMASDTSTPEPPRRRASKVQQLAREYSKRLKDHQKGNWFKRFSTVVEEPPEDGPPELQPDWLKELRERKKSKGSSQESQDELSPPMPEAAGLLTPIDPPHKKGSPPLMFEDTPKASSLARLNPGQSSMALMSQYADGEKGIGQLPRSQSTDFELERVDTPDPVELQRKGGLKGWVKSIVVRFGGNK